MEPGAVRRRTPTAWKPNRTFGEDDMGGIIPARAPYPVSVQLGPGSLHHLRPLADVLLQDAAKLLRAGGIGIGAGGGEFLQQVLVLKDFPDVAVDLADHGFRRAGGSQQAEPGAQLETR